jgi:hypothetical protein
MYKFLFGSKYDKNIVIKAHTLDNAINIFKVQELYPEKYVDEQDIIKKEYNNIYGDYKFIFNETPQISIYKFPIDFKDNLYHNKKGRFVKKISLYECINVEFPTTKSQSLLDFSNTEHDNNDKSEIILSLNSPSIKKDISSLNKMEIREIDNLVKTKLYELEQQRQELKEFANKLQNELKEKLKMIYVIETYMGIKEQIYELQKGSTSSNDEPLSIYQAKLYMDEEVGIWEDDGLDFNNIELFDEWLLKDKNYEKFLYREQSVCAFQIRRHDKKYDEEAFLNAIMNRENRKTYILIRNGENLYRIWSNVSFPEKFFPSNSDFEKVLEEAEKWNRNEDEAIKKIQENHAYGFIALQGILERTSIFNESVKTINLFNPNSFNDDRLNLIRDAEQDFWLNDGKPSWYDFIRKNRSTINQGTRVVVTKNFSWIKKDETWRHEPFWPGSGPSMSEIYIVEEIPTEETYWEWHIKILYHSRDTIYDRDSYDSHERQKRVPFRLYTDEVLNYDEITIEDCEYYRHNRYERKNYLEILPILYYVQKSKIEEKKAEDEFIKFLIPRLNIDVEENQIREVIKWWKLKNKWKRDIFKDEAKASRMVIKEINRRFK